MKVTKPNPLSERTRSREPSTHAMRQSKTKTQSDIVNIAVITYLGLLVTGSCMITQSETSPHFSK